jgi:hypothetical protein
MERLSQVTAAGVERGEHGCQGRRRLLAAAAPRTSSTSRFLLLRAYSTGENGIEERA